MYGTRQCIVDYNYVQGETSGNFRWHSGGANYLWVDGHVSWYGDDPSANFNWTDYGDWANNLFRVDK